MNPFLLLLGLVGGSLAGLGKLKKEADLTNPKSGKGDDPVVVDDPVIEDPVAEDPVIEDPVIEDPTSEDPMSHEDPTTHEDPTSEDPVSHEDPTSHEDATSEDPMSHHNDGSEPAIPVPGPDASAAEIDAYVDAVIHAEEVHVHDMTSDKTPEHNAALNLVPRDAATHIAVSDGSWFDPATWYNGEIPGDDARVLIPEGICVDYDGMSDARLFTVRVDGKLDFASDTNSQIMFDTIVVSPTGAFEIGTIDDPVHADVNVDLIVLNNGPIDTDWDPLLLSRGIVSHGEATIHGAVKDSHEKVIEDPMAGDTSVTFAEIPEGWQAGDTIVIAGTHYDGYKWDNEIDTKRLYPAEDEVRTIASIDGNVVYFDDPLVHDHDSPREDLKTSVANYTRNVSVETENYADAEVFERGHVMFMHSDDVDVRYAEFLGLGRTDKSEDSFDVSDFETTEFDSNVQGRYSLHLHRTGVGDLDDPAIVIGNAVYDSPGWGYVHHDSNALLENNASYDTFGAGFVAETGNETGAWIDNIAIYAEGISWAIPKNTTTIDADTFDTARGGDGFWFQGRLVDAVDNVAASVNTGFVYFHRDGDDRMIEFDAALFGYSEALYHDATNDADDAPILVFSNNEAFAAKEGLHVVKANPNQGHDVQSHLDGFTAWSVKTGAHLEYTSHYILTDFDIIGKESTQFSDPIAGISLGKNTSEITIIDAKISGFETGIDLHKQFVDTSVSPELHSYIVVDADITDVAVEYGNYDPALDRIVSRDSLGEQTMNLEIDGPLTYKEGYPDPDARIVEITGTKTDGLGDVRFPNGTDGLEMKRGDVIAVLEEKGYWQTSDGNTYFLIDLHFTDRLTGDIYYETHPVYVDGNVPLGSETASGGHYGGAESNGVQDIVTIDGVLWAGDTMLGTAMPAIPATETAAMDTSMDMAMHTDIAMASQMWMDGYDGDTTLTIDVTEGQFINSGTAGNIDLTATGGETVLATDDAEFDVTAGRTLAVFAAAAKVGFDGEAGGMAILDMHEGSTLAFSAEDGDFGTIEEFQSGAFGDAPDVQSGIDLGNVTLEIDLSGLSAEAGTAFTLMDSDELVGLFDAATVGGLGARDATIVVDYLADSVMLELTAGTGLVSVHTLGNEADHEAGEDALWAALTADQKLAEDLEVIDEELDPLIAA